MNAEVYSQWNQAEGLLSGIGRSIPFIQGSYGGEAGIDERYELAGDIEKGGNYPQGFIRRREWWSLVR